MSITIQSLTAQLNQLHQQRNAAANMAQQCLGGINVVQRQLEELTKAAKEAELKKAAEEEERRLQENVPGEPH